MSKNIKQLKWWKRRDTINLVRASLTKLVILKCSKYFRTKMQGYFLTGIFIVMHERLFNYLLLLGLGQS